MSSHLTKETARILSTVVIGVNLLFYLPIGLYFSWQFFKLRHDTFISKRRPILVIMTIVFVYIWMLVARTIDVYRALENVNTNAYILGIVTDSGWLCGNIVVLRLWLLFYDYKRGVHLSSLRWKTIIEPSTIPWTIKYKHLADVKYLILFALSQWLIIELVAIVGTAVHSTNIINLSQILYILCALPTMVVLAIRVRKFDDDYHIKKEMKLLLIWFIIFIAIYGGGVMPFLVLDSIERVLVMAFLTSLLGFICIVSWTAYPVYQLKKRHQLSVMKVHETVTPVSFRKFLSNRYAFEAFANQLIRELSVENLLFLLEMIQIKTKIVNTELLRERHIGFMLTFDKKVMYVQREMSVIQNVDDAMQQIGYIVDHYIAPNGDYSVNIVSTQRQQILIATDLIRDDDKECTPQILQAIKQKKYGDLRAHKRMARMRAVTAPNIFNAAKKKQMVQATSIDFDEELTTEEKEPNDEDTGARTAIVNFGNTKSVVNVTTLTRKVSDYTALEDDLENELSDAQKILARYIELIDGAMEEVYGLMRKDSYVRFTGSQIYAKILQFIASKDTS